jgi:hypothetical protein
MKKSSNPNFKYRSTAFLILVLLQFSIFVNKTEAQLDYDILKKTRNLSCAKLDSTKVKQNKEFLDSLANLELTSGKEMFYYDYAMNYYHNYCIWKKTEDLEKSITINKKCWEDYENIYALWNLLLNYYLIKDCESYQSYSTVFLIKFKEQELEDYVFLDDIEKMNKYCQNKKK